MGWGTWGRQAGPGMGNLGEGLWGGKVGSGEGSWSRQAGPGAGRWTMGVVRWALGRAGGPWRVPFSCKLSSRGLCRQ